MTLEQIAKIAAKAREERESKRIAGEMQALREENARLKAERKRAAEIKRAEREEQALVDEIYADFLAHGGTAGKETSK